MKSKNYFYLGAVVLMAGFIFGNNNGAFAQCSTCVNNCTTDPIATGDCSFATGEGAEATGDNSAAIGNGAHASADESIAIGGTASGFGSVSIGAGSAVSGSNSIAIGDATTTGSESYAIGGTITSAGDNSIVIGRYAVADGSYNHNYIFGLGLREGDLLNNITNSIMIGMNSNLPTMFIQGAEGSTGNWGKVGIGTTSPTGILHVREESGSDTKLIAEKYDGTNGGLYFNTGSTESGYVLMDDNEDMLVYNRTADRHIRFAIKKSSTQTEVMRIVGNTARVGIGTTGPSAKFHVAAVAGEGTAEEPIARFSVSDVSNTTDFLQIENKDADNTEFAGMIVGRSSATDNEALFLRASVNDDSGTKSAMTFDSRDHNSGSPQSISVRPLFSWTNFDNQQMIMDASGNVAIGTVSPTNKLDVDGGVRVRSLPAGIGIPVNADGSGNLTDGTTSSIYFKENIQDLEFDKEAFLSMKPVSYNWKEFYGGSEDVGFIAQDVAKAFPQLSRENYKMSYLPNGDVARDAAGHPKVDSTKLEPYGVKYHKLPVYLFVLAQEQDKMIKDMTKEMKEMRAEIEMLKSEITSGQGYNTNGVNNYLHGSNEFVLLQNDPNPFNDYTDITYESANCQNCEILITDMMGRIIKRISVYDDRGSIRVFSSEIGNGTFTYSLVKDGKIMKTQRLLSSK